MVWKLIVSLGYASVALGSWGMMMYATKFLFATRVDDHEFSETKWLRMNGAQVWSRSWTLIVVGTLIQLLYVWA